MDGIRTEDIKTEAGCGTIFMKENLMSLVVSEFTKNIRFTR